METKKIGYLLTIFSLILIVSLFFIKLDLDKQSTYLCTLTAENPNREMSDCPAHQNSVSWLIMFAFGISFLIFGAGVYMSTLKETKKPKVNLSKLDKEEKQIYNIIKNHESIYQSDLTKETDFSKVKITRILDKLESKKIIERRRRHR